MNTNYYYISHWLHFVGDNMGLFDRFKTKTENEDSSGAKPKSKRQLIKIIKDKNSSLDVQLEALSELDDGEVLKRVVMDENLADEVRLKALEKINDDSVLMPIIRSDEVCLEIRLRAVEKISDWTNLRGLARNTTVVGITKSEREKNLEAVRNAATSRVEDDDLLFDIVKNDFPTKYEAIRTIRNEKMLMEIVDDEEIDFGYEALSNPNLKDREFLLKKAFENILYAKEVVRNPSFNDDRGLSQIVCHYIIRDYDGQNVNLYAIGKINDEKVLADIIKKFPGDKVTLDYIKDITIGIDDDVILEDIVLNAQNIILRELACEKIENEDILFNIFIETGDFGYYIIPKISDKDRLNQILKKETTVSNRVKIYELLGITYDNTDDERILTDFVIYNDCNDHMGVLAKIKDPKLLCEIADYSFCDLSTFKRIVRKLGDADRIDFAMHFKGNDEKVKFLISRISDEKDLIELMQNAYNDKIRYMASERIEDSSYKGEYEQERCRDLERQLESEKGKMPELYNILRSSSQNLLKYDWESRGKSAESKRCYLLALEAYTVQERIHSSLDNFARESYSSAIERNEANLERVRNMIGYIPNSYRFK